MNISTLLLILALLLPAPVARAQGFAGLGQSADGFALPLRGTALSFPRDHGAHPDYRIEWWYLTATLTGADGRDYGVQWTLFRSAIRPPGAGTPDTPWQTPQLWMGHAGVTTPDAHYLDERRARGGIGQAGVRTGPFTAWIDDWQMIGSSDDLTRLHLTASGPDFTYALDLTATGPLVLHGDNGYSVKSAQGQASYYYSQPGYDVTGVLNLPGGPVTVTGKGWLDREWSSQPLGAAQSGWDWFSLGFDDGTRLMGFRLRGDTDYTSGTWIDAAGQATAFSDGDLQVAPLDHSTVAGRKVPTTWRLTLPARGVDVKITALNPQAWMATSFPYWEGPVTIQGSHGGRGYLEMTGYD